MAVEMVRRAKDPLDRGIELLGVVFVVVVVVIVINVVSGFGFAFGIIVVI